MTGRAVLFQRFQGASAPREASVAPDAVAHIPQFVNEVLGHLSPDLPTPKVQVVDRTGVSWLGRCVWKPGEDNTTILLQRSIVGDEETLKRILAHELCHHDEFLTKWGPMAKSKALNLLMRVEGDHGSYFQGLANKLNAIYGSDFVSKESDNAMVVEGTKEVLVLLRKTTTGKISWAYAVRPSAAQRTYLEELLTSGTWRGRTPTIQGEYRLTKGRDSFLTLGSQVGKNWSSTRDAGLNERLEALWEASSPDSKVANAADEQEAFVADMKRKITGTHVADRFRAAFPTWAVELSGTEVFALSPAQTDITKDLVRVRALAGELGVLVSAQPRAGRTLIIVDLSGVPTR
jgi:hypothetical protein